MLKRKSIAYPIIKLEFYVGGLKRKFKRGFIMELKTLCSDVIGLLNINFEYGYLIVWKEGYSWNWYPILNDDYDYVSDGSCGKDYDEKYDEGFDFKIKDKETMQMMNKIMKVDCNATIIMSEELESDTWTCKSLMEDIKRLYGDREHSLKGFYNVCCVGY